jgi:hypothetical protein
MSLQIAAQHLSSQGRGNDSMLVHMSPREVSSLNALAKAHGGQLTINPHTGLAEAGFLESILPMAAGFALNAALPGSGMLVPALVGGGMALMTGSLEKGLMAGLGAYGGANLGQTLAAQGMEQAAAAELAPTLGAQQATAAQGITNQFGNVAANGIPAGQTQAYIDATKAAYAPATDLVQTAQTNALNNYNALDFPGKLSQNFNTLTSPGGASGLFDKVTSSPMSLLKTVGSSLAPAASEALKPKKPEEEKPDTDMGQRYAYSPGYVNPMPGASATGQERTFMNPTYRPIGNEEAKKIYGFADGGSTPAASPAGPPVPTSYTSAEPTLPLSMPAPAFNIPNVNSMADLVYAPESRGLVNAYLNRPAPIDVQAQYNEYLQRTLNAPPMAVANSGLPTVKPVAEADETSEFIFDPVARQYIKNPKFTGASSEEDEVGRAAGGSISGDRYNLGGYSDGGRLLRGPGDGVSDSIPAVIGRKQPARLADGEFVVPARIVSELGNGSTEAGARKLYAMMDRIQKARGKTIGKGKVAKNSRSEKYLPA